MQALGFRNQNPRHGKTSPLLDESTTPQGVMVSSFLTHTFLTRGDDLRVISMLAILLSIPCIRLSNPS
jgi:type III secretory pathway component EscT